MSEAHATSTKGELMKIARHFICSIFVLTLPLISALHAKDRSFADSATPVASGGLKDKAKDSSPKKQKVEHKLNIRPKTAPGKSCQCSKQKGQPKKSIWNWFKR